MERPRHEIGALAEPCGCTATWSDWQTKEPRACSKAAEFTVDGEPCCWDHGGCYKVETDNYERHVAALVKGCKFCGCVLTDDLLPDPWTAEAYLDLDPDHYHCAACAAVEGPKAMSAREAEIEALVEAETAKIREEIGDGPWPFWATARLMAIMDGTYGTEEGDEWDRWKDEMKEAAI